MKYFFACDRRGGVAKTSEKAFEAKKNGRQAQADEAVVVVAA